MTMTQVEPAPHRTDFLLTSKLRELFRMSQDKKKSYQAPWRRNYLLTTNRQYSSTVQQPWAPNLTDSEIFPILSTRIAWMTDQRIAPDVSPAAEPNTPFYDYQQTLGQHLQSLLLSNQMVDGWDQQIVLALWDAAQFGAGIFKSVWDSGMTDGLGNVCLKRIDPWKFYPDPNATSFDDCNYMFEINRMTYTEIKRKFPSLADTVLITAVEHGTIGDQASRPGPGGNGQYPMAMPGNLPTSTGTVWGLPGQTNSRAGVMADGINVYECWVKETDELTRPATTGNHPTPEDVVMDRWRVIVFSNDVVLLDEYADNLWTHNRHPYTRYVDEEMGEFFPVPLVSHLAPAQIAINRLLSAMQSSAELTGNPIFMDVANSGLARTQIVNRPGQRLTLSSQATQQGSDPKWMEPPTMSSDVPNTIQFWLSRMENISGISGVQRGQAPAGRQAQQTVQATQEAASVRTRSSLRNLERALSTAYTLLADLVIQNYTIPRVVAILGDDSTNSTLRLAAKHFYSPTSSGAAPLKFALVVQAGSSNPTSRQARIAEADALFAMHAVDTTFVLEAHAIANWQQVAKRVEQKQQAAAQAQVAQKQQAKGPGTGHEH